MRVLPVDGKDPPSFLSPCGESSIPHPPRACHLVVGKPPPVCVIRWWESPHPICFKVVKIETERFYLFQSFKNRNGTFLFVPKVLKTKTEFFTSAFKFFFTSLERLYLFQASPVSKLNFSIKTKKYQNENKMFAVSLKFVVSKQNNIFDTTV